MDDDCAIEEEARKVAAKPALKKHPLHNAVDGNATPTDVAGGEDARKKKGHLKWDEEVIAEHDQLRGTRMKVRVCEMFVVYQLVEDSMQIVEAYDSVMSQSTHARLHGETQFQMYKP